MKILVVGHTCLDYLLFCNSYPAEDSKIGSTTYPNRCIDYYTQRGGNASNNCTVLASLKANPFYFGTLAKTLEGRYIEEDFKSFGINIKYAVWKDAQCPLSFVTIAKDTGSRTIIHTNKNLPELSLEEFKKVDLEEFSWIHFEGRSHAQICEMIEYIKNFRSKYSHEVTVSVEVEKISLHLEALIPLADVVFVSKDFAESKGFCDMREGAAGIAKLAKNDALVICPWGKDGAAAVDNSTGGLFSCPASPPAAILDTLGAGDTFIASTVFALSKKLALKESLEFGCALAGAKIGTKGWEGLRRLFEDQSFTCGLKERFPRLQLAS